MELRTICGFGMWLRRFWAILVRAHEDTVAMLVISADLEDGGLGGGGKD